MQRLAFLVLGVTFWLGCRSRQPPSARHWHGCRCEYVTDFDEPGRIDVQVCSEGEVPAGAAESCARNLGVGAVSRCLCPASSQGPVCPSYEICREAIH